MIQYRPDVSAFVLETFPPQPQTTNYILLLKKTTVLDVHARAISSVEGVMVFHRG